MRRASRQRIRVIRVTVAAGTSRARREPGVRARDLAVEYETVGLDSDAMDAARLMAEHRLPALLVVDERGTPKAILPASQMVKILVPVWVVEDPTFAAVVDDRRGDRLCRR
ncbi:CBS domain-containing protein [Streptomyces prunicolor]|uniref:CBS domain-containing protein n=1 Tax=Streptomyces prunicolor TaxID=67348 RepID=UPI003F4DF437